MPAHHLSDEILMAYAAGSLPEPLSLVVVSHVTLCPACRAQMETYEALGGSLIEEIAPVGLPDSALSDIFARLDDEASGPGEADPWGRAPARTPADHRSVDGSVPRPLRDYLGQDLSALNWRSVIRGVEEAEIALDGGEVRTRLMRIQPGVAVPKHTHGGEEVTLVLTGGYSDAGGHYARGDVQVADPTVDHQPVADPGEPCLCLVISDAPLKLTGPIGRWLNPFITY
ncbi:ChrR family anti-sigma-E factor [Pelagibius sp.]|uniref:ChrR family anti-sigma-E factor n=1 Tax=Pelagibius sp. TaxID=1931238 RepID=UPI002626911F|nr:ChrR family anti-sigma-E factor [Pelagibius sp.]